MLNTIMCSFLQRIATATHQGGPSELQLERFAEALNDPASSVIYPALTGQRKQSVSNEMLNQRGYKFEAKFIEVIGLQQISLWFTEVIKPAVMYLYCI